MPGDFKGCAKSDVVATLDAIEKIDRAASCGRVEDAVNEAKLLQNRYGHYLQIALKKAGLSVPSLLLVGPPRTGTTWLKGVLGDHPDIQMAIGEPNVLWNAGDGGLHKALHWYALPDVWRGPQKSTGIIAEKSPSYICLPESAICVLTALHPKLKIVIGRRNETERLWSAISHRMHDVGFHGAWDDFCIEFRSDVLHELNLGKIDTHLSRWQKSLDSDNIFIYQFEDITRSPQILVNKILNHLSVRPIKDLSPIEHTSIVERIRINPNPSNIGTPPSGLIEVIATSIS